MTTAPAPTLARRRRPAVVLLSLALGLAVFAGVFGFTTSPGRSGGGARQSEVAIPGIRGTGGGAGVYGVSSSPGRVELAVRKAGGRDPIFF